MKEPIRRFIEGLNEYDLPKTLETLHEQAVFVFPVHFSFGGAHTGKSQIAHLIKYIFRLWKLVDPQNNPLRVVSYVEKGDQAALEWAKNLGPGAGGLVMRGITQIELDGERIRIIRDDFRGLRFRPSLTIQNIFNRMWMPFRIAPMLLWGWRDIR